MDQSEDSCDAQESWGSHYFSFCNLGSLQFEGLLGDGHVFGRRRRFVFYLTEIDLILEK